VRVDHRHAFAVDANVLATRTIVIVLPVVTDFDRLEARQWCGEVLR
jgi:hypothetical protein